MAASECSIGVAAQTDAFAAKELAATEWAGTSTRPPNGYAEREFEQQAPREHVTVEEIVELTWGAVINAWNRIAIEMHQPVDTKLID